MTTTTKAAKADPTTDPTAPALNPPLLALTGGTTIVGVIAAIASALGATPAGVNPGTSAWVSAGIALLGMLATLTHSKDVGTRFLAWLSTEHGRVSAVEPKIAALAAQVEGIAKVADPTLAANVEKRLATLEAQTHVTPDTVRQAVRDVLAGASTGGVVSSAPASGGGLTVAPTVPPVSL